MFMDVTPVGTVHVASPGVVYGLPLMQLAAWADRQPRLTNAEKASGFRALLD
jgi:hypothetical protein